VEDVEGCTYYIDPFSNAGASVLSGNGYEPELRAELRDRIQPGDTIIDVGANEGILSVFMARLVGPQGHVIAIEPQSQLQDLIRINAALNATTDVTTIIHAALGGPAGATGVIYLYPGINSGASSIVRRYRFSARTERITFLTIEQALQRAGTGSADLMKVDVEGYEPEVVESILPTLRDGRIRQLFLDYHTSTLAARGINTHALHERILETGMLSARVAGTGYVTYCRQSGGT
jgi:FkbM family methyltransferase